VAERIRASSTHVEDPFQGRIQLVTDLLPLSPDDPYHLKGRYGSFEQLRRFRRHSKGVPAYTPFASFDQFRRQQYIGWQEVLAISIVVSFCRNSLP
jgi:hypothetical protein